jgi:YVTN family beta-propeller protein
VHLWVTQRWGKSVAVVDLASGAVIETIPVGKSPHGIYLTHSAPWRCDLMRASRLVDRGQRGCAICVQPPANAAERGSAVLPAWST